MASGINFFAKTNFRGREEVFGIKTDDRRRHMWIVGKSGGGKTNLLLTLARNDLEAGRGLSFVDPHGDAAKALLQVMTTKRIKDVIYFNPADREFPIGFNIMEAASPESWDVVASGIVGTFKKLWSDSWGPRLENILRNSVLALLEIPGSTLLSLQKLLLDEKYRADVIKNIQDPVVKEFWQKQFLAYNERYRTEVIESTLNKLLQFTSSPVIRHIVGQKKSTFNLRQVMDERKILVVNLSKGKIGEDNACLLGSLILTKIQQTAMERADLPEQNRLDHYCFVDEFQNFATQSFVNILSEARKYRLNLILAHQFIDQLESDIFNSVLGNTGSFIFFRLGSKDAAILEEEIKPGLTAYDLINLPKYHIIIKLMVDGLAGAAFSAVTMKLDTNRNKANMEEKIVRASRSRYGRPRASIEAKIRKWADAGTFKPKTKPRKYKVECSACGKKTKVSFEPDGIRPVFCPKCFKDFQSRRDKIT